MSPSKQKMNIKNRPVLSLLFILMFSLVHISLVLPASAGQLQPDIKKNTIKKDGIDKKRTNHPGTAPAVKPSQVPGAVPRYLEITWFKASKKQFVVTAAAASGSKSRTRSTHPITVHKGDRLFFSWQIQGSGIDPDQLNIRLGGRDLNRHSRVVQQPNSRFVITGSMPIGIREEADYTLSVAGGPTRTLRQSIHISLYQPNIQLVVPDVDQDNLTITLKGRNTGLGAIYPEDDLDIHCLVLKASGPNRRLAEQLFSFRDITLRPGQQINFGTVSLTDPSLAFAANAIKIIVTASQGDTILHKKDWHYTWAVKTAVINPGHLRLLGRATDVDIRINNWDGSANPPHKANDSTIYFKLSDYLHDSTFDIPPHTERIAAEDIQTFLRDITCRHNGDPELFSLVNKKIGLNLYFPNSGSREIKRGRIKKANPDKGKWQDGLATDIDLRAFTIRAYITPVIEDKRITYRQVEVDTSEVSARTGGSYPGTPAFRDYLSRVAGRNIRNQIKPILQSRDVKAAITNALNEALFRPGTTIHRIISLTIGHNIEIKYL